MPYKNSSHIISDCEETYRSLIEASLNPLVIISFEGKITHANEATVKIIGVPRTKLEGSNFFDYFTEPEKARETYQEVFVKGSVLDAPLTVRSTAGILSQILFNGSVYKDGKGNVLGAMVVARDVTRQKHHEKELVDAKNAAERARITAEKNSESRQEILSNMSQAVRTPVNEILEFTNDILKTDLNDEQKDYLNAIKLSGDSLIGLLNDMLDLVKVNSGKMVFEKTSFKLHEVISKAVEAIEAEIEEKQLELIKEYDAAVPENLTGDPMRLQQMVSNLLHNAIRNTPEGKISISIKLINADAQHTRIEFKISDSGSGILEDISRNEHIGSNGSAGLHENGLGLAIVKSLLAAQGGTLKIDHKPGTGSVFSFTLPFTKVKEKADGERKSGTSKLRVLIVEDVMLSQMLMKNVVEEFGYETEIAGNGKIAIEKLQQGTYDIILMDLQMPEMNGFEATEYIRTKMNSQIPIIALTASITSVEIEKCNAVGMNDYSEKPIDEKLLHNKIMKHLSKNIQRKTNGMNSETSKKTRSKYTNLDYLKQRTKNNPEMIMEMIDIYLTETPKMIEKMKESRDNMDWDSLAGAAHSIIPSFMIMGISKDYEMMARNIQEYAKRQEKAAAINELVLKLEEVCTQACKELRGEMKNMKLLAA